jgi:hypothetical protein
MQVPESQIPEQHAAAYKVFQGQVLAPAAATAAEWAGKESGSGCAWDAGAAGYNADLQLYYKPLSYQSSMLGLHGRGIQILSTTLMSKVQVL